MAVVENESSRALLPGLSRLRTNQIIGLGLTVATIIALVVGAFLWGQQPEYRVLYSNLSDRDGGAIIASLQQMNVPYKYAEGGGAILVPSVHVHDARLRLASQGLPKGSLVGFELMENQKFGVSQFAEQVNYQRGLEGELARSIQSLAAVEGARVHLALAKQSVFVREQQKPSASVLLTLHPGRTLDAGQVNAITHLVSSSVPELAAKSITVVDQNGSLLSAPSDAVGDGAADPAQLKFRHDLEQSYVAKIEDILLPIVGPGNVRAQVAAEIDFSHAEQVAELYKPNQDKKDIAIRSLQQNESTNTTGGAQAGGVPGALSNQPPANATAPITTNGANGAAGGANQAGAGPASTQRENTTNFELDKTLRHTNQPMGSVKRLSAAVVVNFRKETDAKGKVSWKPLSDAERKQIDELVRQAMGFDTTRKDTLNVVNTPFSVPEKEVIAEVPLWKQPETIAMAKDIGRYLLVAMVVLYLVMGVLRPLLRRLSEPDPVLTGDVITADGGGGDENEDGTAVALSGAENSAPGRLSSYDEKLQNARALAKQDPQVVASVVKGWVGSNG